MTDISQSAVSLVTGAYGGIGQGVAVELARRGLAVVCADIQGADETVETISAFGGTASSVVLDVRDSESWTLAVRYAEDLYGPVSALANVAGIASAAGDNILELTDELWTRVIDVNARGTWFGMRAVLPAMLERGRGSIVNTTSIAASLALESCAAYSASKGAVAALTRQAAAQYGPQGVRVNAIEPGTIASNINAESLADPATRAAVAGLSLLGTIGEPAQIARTYAHLLADDTFITGQVILVDGGWSVSGGRNF